MWKRLYNHQCPSVRSLVCLKAKPPNSIKSIIPPYHFLHHNPHHHTHYLTHNIKDTISTPSCTSHTIIHTTILPCIHYTTILPPSSSFDWATFKLFSLFIDTFPKQLKCERLLYWEFNKYQILDFNKKNNILILTSQILNRKYLPGPFKINFDKKKLDQTYTFYKLFICPRMFYFQYPIC